MTRSGGSQIRDTYGWGEWDSCKWHDWYLKQFYNRLHTACFNPLSCTFQLLRGGCASDPPAVHAVLGRGAAAGPRWFPALHSRGLRLPTAGGRGRGAKLHHTHLTQCLLGGREWAAMFSVKDIDFCAELSGFLDGDGFLSPSGNTKSRGACIIHLSSLSYRNVRQS